MMILEEVIEKLKPMNLSTIARETKLPYITVWKIANNAYKSVVPYDAVKIISDYLESR
jgi:hypothetical protein